MADNRINPATGKRYAWEAEQREKSGQALLQAQKEARKHVQLLERAQAAMEARERFMPFIKFTSPDPEDPNDVTKSKYKNARHHDAIARVIEEVVDGNIPFLILTMPPRHGKSEQVSRKLPAWFIGRFPTLNGVVATYNDDFAADFGKDVRTLVKTPQFRQVFPNVGLQRGGAASDRLQTLQGGQWSFVGRGGSLTGRGAHCFVSGTLVMTKDGDRPIDTIGVGDEVLSFDGEKLCWRRVQALSHRQGARIFRVASAAGRVVEATGDHPFYTGGRWIEAAKLASGDPLLCAVRNVGDETGVRRGEAREPRAREILLLRRLLGCRGERAAAWVSRVLPLRGACSPAAQRRDASERENFLFGSLHGGRAAGGTRAARSFAHAAVRTLQRHVRAAEQRAAVLLTSLRFAASRGGGSRCGKPALAGWGRGEQSEAARHSTISGASPVGASPGRAEMRSLRGHGASGGSPYRREPAEQSRVELGHAVPAVSRDGALLAREDDAVRAVEDTGRYSDVYDIQVEGTHCFFANGVLVHNCLIIDDLIKDDKEAQSQAIRDQAWSWFTKVAMSRRMGKKLVIMTFTRWHADDPIGRLTDPENPYYSHALAQKIKIINLPAIAEEDDPLGRQPGEALWPDGPDKFDLDFLEEQRSLDPLGFAALYQQRPSLLDGDLFKRDTINFYKPKDLPKDLRIYAASDHAVATGQRNDFTVLLKVGVDPQNNIYLLDCVWAKIKSDVAVERILDMCRGDQRPLLWWAEKGHISKSIGPFLRKRMAETGIYLNIREVTPVADKAQRAQSIAGRVAMGKVFFPQDALWTEKAINQMMSFPNGTHDDFVDTLAYIGLGLQSQFAPPSSSAKKNSEQPKFGTLAWVKLADKWSAEQRAAQRAGGF